MRKNAAGGRRPAPPGKALDPEQITTEEVTRRLAGRLRTLIGPSRAWSYRGVAQLTGIDERSLHAYVRGETCPNLAKFKRLLSVLGPELSADLDLMYGWPTRASASRPGSLDLKELARELRELLASIDAAIAQAKPD